MRQLKLILGSLFYLFFQFAEAEHPINEIITIEIVKERFCNTDVNTSAPFTFFKNPTFTFFVPKTKPENMKNKIKEIKGIYIPVPNPCLTEPCLPGITGAIKTEKNIYFLFKNDHFTDDSFFWEDIFPQHGDTLVIRGILDTMTDIKGEEFKVIKISSILKSE